jgi:hypothetical protein
MMSRILVLALIAGWRNLAVASPVEVTPFDLADRRIPAPPGVTTANVGTGACALTKTTDGKAWTFASECQELARLTGTFSVGAVVVKLASGEPLRGLYQHDVRDRSVHIETAKPIEKVAFLGANGWEVDDVTDGKAFDGAVEALKAKGARDLWARQGNSLYALTVTKKASGTDGTGPTCPFASSPDWCTAPDGMQSAEFICLDATDGRFVPHKFTPTNHVLAPNRSLVVIVHHSGDHGVEIAMKGTRGLHDAVVANYTGGLLDKRVEGQQAEGGAATCTAVTVAPFAPRKPGDADVTIELRDRADRSKVIATKTIELIVDATYAGAIRLGFATVLGNAVDRTYEANVAPGSLTSEIKAREASDVDIELVVGVSGYALDLIMHGGRRYSDRGAASYLVPSPYLGVGIVTPRGDGLRAIPSLHLGAEWELSKSFAVSVTAVARRVTRLSDGYHVGSPISAMTSFHEDRNEWGWAVVVSVSPEFFQISAGKP